MPRVYSIKLNMSLCLILFEAWLRYIQILFINVESKRMLHKSRIYVKPKEIVN